MVKQIGVMGILLAVLLVGGCAQCDSCKDIPGWDGRYATHDRGALNRENHGGLPVTPYGAP
ncbi:hypothetical protein SAMN02745126_00760 [Enhydrobacter aerosaccus]|uniref:Lipoprotein n=1 Tax=Enhydrobacter aerosaccus TaxID=225324 RepID=A0A1T4K6W4_9HYPH|nr:hypothetical protein SAMN02745126_00760 [Enhydrobacter aerosaccus]